MKNANQVKQLFLLIALAITTMAFGQGLKSEISYSKYRSQSVVDIACEGHFTYLLYRGISNLAEHWIVKSDSSGNILFEVPYYLPNAESFEQLRMIANGQNLYIFGQAFINCDVADCFSFVTKLDLNGTTQLQLDLQAPNCTGGIFVPLNIGPNGEIIIGIQGSPNMMVFVYSSTGTLLDTVSIPYNTSFWLGINASGNLSCATTQSIYVVNAAGVALFSRSFPINLREVLYVDSTYLVTTLDTIYILNDSLTIIDKIYFSGYNDFRKLKKLGSEFQVLANMGSVRHVLTFDFNQVLRDIVIPIGYVLWYFQDHSSVVYSMGITNNNVGSTTVRQLNYSLLNTNSISVSSPDIGIVNQELLQAHMWPYSVSQDIYGLSANIRVLVKNYSSYPVDSFKVNSSNYMIGGICTQEFLSERFHQTIFPGDSAWVELPTIYFDYFYAPQGASVERLICASTSDPNGIADTNSYNNQHCEMSFLGYASVEEMEENSILLFPNPGSETINISHGLNGTLSYQVLNSQGQVVLKGSLYENSIDVGSLSSGLFFIQFFQNQKLLSTQKWMKI
jgi:hypothetical protein